MSDTGHIMFTVNELIAIHTALQSQVENCEDFLNDPSIRMDYKPQLAKSLKYSKSALTRLKSIFADLGIDPEKTE